MLDAKDTATKRLTQQERILLALVEAGPRGCTSAELYAIGFRFGGRIFELRRKGWKIATEAIPGTQLDRYVLTPDVVVPMKQADLFALPLAPQERH